MSLICGSRGCNSEVSWFFYPTNFDHWQLNLFVEGLLRPPDASVNVSGSSRLSGCLKLWEVLYRRTQPRREHLEKSGVHLMVRLMVSHTVLIKWLKVKPLFVENHIRRLQSKSNLDHFDQSWRTKHFLSDTRRNRTPWGWMPGRFINELYLVFIGASIQRLAMQLLFWKLTDLSSHGPIRSS